MMVFSNTYPAASTSNQPQTTKQKPEEVHPRSLTSKVYPWKPWLEQKEDDKIRLPFLGPRYLGSWIFVFRSYFLVELQVGISSLTNQKTLATHTHTQQWASAFLRSHGLWWVRWTGGVFSVFFCSCGSRVSFRVGCGESADVLWPM